MTLRYALGIGCRSVCTFEALQAFVIHQLAEHDLTPDDIDVLATWAPRGDHPAILALAAAYRWPLKTYTADRLNTMASRLTRRSETLYERIGVYSVAESAALCAADDYVPLTVQILVPLQHISIATLTITEFIL